MASKRVKRPSKPLFVSCWKRPVTPVKLQYIGASLDCAYTTLLRHNFVATGCEKQQEPQTGQGEFTEAVTMSLAEFRQHLRSGQLTDIETGYLGLDYLGLL